jgi:hypothetical protein
MSTGQFWLDAALLAAMFLGILSWMVFMTTKSRAQRKQELAMAKIFVQPWQARQGRGRADR